MCVGLIDLMLKVKPYTFQYWSSFLRQVTVLLPGGQNMNAANLHVLSNVADAPPSILEPVSQVREGYGRDECSL